MSEHQKINGFRNKIAVVCGIAFFLFLFVLGITISNSIVISNPPFGQMVLFSIFIGISTGHFIGMAMTREIDKIHFFLVGFFTFAFLFFVLVPFYISISANIVWTLLLSAIFILLAHLSNLIHEHENIEKLINLFGKYGSGFVLGISGLYLFLIPFLSKILGG